MKIKIKILNPKIKKKLLQNENYMFKIKPKN